MILMTALFVGLLFTPLSIAQAILIMVPLLILRASIRKSRKQRSAPYANDNMPFGG